MRRSALLAIPVIGGLIGLLYGVCGVLSLALGLPGDLHLPWWVRLTGAVPLGYGVLMMAWVFRSRGPATVLDSTWATFLKLFRRVPIDAPADRTEPLVVAGPYRLVRHPLYSGVDGLTFGIAILVDHPWAYLGALALALWFLLALAPFEERELRALFGAPYDSYARSTRRFLPLHRRP